MNRGRPARKWLARSGKWALIAFAALCLLSSITLEQGALGFSSVTSIGAVGILVGLPLLALLVLAVFLLGKAALFGGRRAIQQLRRIRADRAAARQEST